MASRTAVFGGLYGLSDVIDSATGTFSFEAINAAADSTTDPPRPP